MAPYPNRVWAAVVDHDAPPWASPAALGGYLAGMPRLEDDEIDLQLATFRSAWF